MSVYAINHLCRETLRDHGFRAAMKDDPAKAIANLPLSDAERRALLAGEVGTLYDMGANAFLMGYLCRFDLLGLTPDTYYDRIVASRRGASGKDRAKMFAAGHGKLPA